MNVCETLKLQQTPVHVFNLCGVVASPVGASQMARGLWFLSRAVGRLRPLLVLGLTRGFSASAPEQLHVCVVGSGPAGFYTADRVGGFTTRPFLSC